MMHTYALSRWPKSLTIGLPIWLFILLVCVGCTRHRVATDDVRLNDICSLPSFPDRFYEIYSLPPFPDRFDAEAANIQTQRERIHHLLVMALNDPDVWVSKAAVRALAYSRSKEAVALLREIFADPNAARHTRTRIFSEMLLSRMERQAAILGKIGKDDPDSAMEIIAETMGRFNMDHLFPVIEEIGGTRALRFLKDMLDEPPEDLPGIAWRAASSLGKAGGRDALPAIKCALSSTNSTVVFGALQSLADVDCPEARNMLLAALKDQDETVRSMAAYALIGKKNEKMLPLIAIAIEDAEETVRTYAVVAFWSVAEANVETKKAKTIVEKALHSHDSNVRGMAIAHLWVMGWDEKESWEWIEKAMNDQNETVRANAVCALMRVDAVQAMPFLEKLIRDPSGIVRGSAVAALSQREERQVRELLEKSLEDPEENVRLRLVDLLKRMEEQKALAMLGKIMADPSVEVRAKALLELRHFDPETALPLLRQALESEEPDVRDAALRTLGKMQGERVLALLEHALKNEDSDMRIGAIHALGQITQRLAQRLEALMWEF